MLGCGFAPRAETIPYAVVHPAYNCPDEVRWTEIGAEKLFEFLVFCYWAGLPILPGVLPGNQEDKQTFVDKGRFDLILQSQSLYPLLSTHYKASANLLYLTSREGCPKYADRQLCPDEEEG